MCDAEWTMDNGRWQMMPEKRTRINLVFITAAVDFLLLLPGAFSSLLFCFHERLFSVAFFFCFLQVSLLATGELSSRPSYMAADGNIVT
jgi:hypothetical protein